MHFCASVQTTYLLRRFHTKAAWRSQRTEPSLRRFQDDSHRALSAVATAGLSETSNFVKHRVISLTSSCTERVSEKCRVWWAERLHDAPHALRCAMRRTTNMVDDRDDGHGERNAFRIFKSYLVVHTVNFKFKLLKNSNHDLILSRTSVSVSSINSYHSSSNNGHSDQRFEIRSERPPSDTN